MGMCAFQVVVNLTGDIFAKRLPTKLVAEQMIKSQVLSCLHVFGVAAQDNSVICYVFLQQESHENALRHMTILQPTLEENTLSPSQIMMRSSQ
jgi:hypothetical protein